MGPIVFGRIAARSAMTSELATGYNVEPSKEILDESLFVKDKADTESFDMSVELKDGSYEATVDGITGATLTANRIKKAVIECLNKAK